MDTTIEIARDKRKDWYLIVIQRKEGTNRIPILGYQLSSKLEGILRRMPLGEQVEWIYDDGVINNRREREGINELLDRYDFRDARYVRRNGYLIPVYRTGVKIFNQK